eukprot:PhM_4_TR12887/c0_g1_i1/m.36447
MSRRASTVVVQEPSPSATASAQPDDNVHYDDNDPYNPNPHKLQRRGSLATNAVHAIRQHRALMDTEQFEFMVLQHQQTAMEEMLGEGTHLVDHHGSGGNLKAVASGGGASPSAGRTTPFNLDAWSSAVRNTEIDPSGTLRNKSALLEYAARSAEASGTTVLPGNRSRKPISRDYIHRFLPGTAENTRLCQELALGLSPSPHYTPMPKARGQSQSPQKSAATATATKRRAPPPRPDAPRLAPVDYGSLLSEQKRMMATMEKSDTEYRRVVQMVEQREYLVQRKLSAVLKLPIRLSGALSPIDDDDFSSGTESDVDVIKRTDL